MHMPSIAPSAQAPSGQSVDVIGSADDLDRLRVVLLRLSRRIRTNSVGGLTPSQFSMFVSVAKFGPCTISHLADLEHMKAPSASKIVAAIEALGLVTRQDDPADRRCSLIAATPAGLEFLDEVRIAGRSWLATRLATLPADDVATLEQALPALELLLGDS